MKGLSVYASGALMDSKFIQGQFSGLRVGDAPDYTAAAGVIYDDGMIFGSLLQKFTGGYYGSSGQKAGSSTTLQSLNYINGYNTTDLVIGVRSSAFRDWGINYGRSVTAKFGIYNIFDKQNIGEIGGDPTGLTSINNTKLTYQFLPGRTIFGSIGIEF
jgi:iron complex outermembrane recepter protein